jgi:EAL domain-containing protein (putative c-di-GMP-specific phosphodiesterase class I)/PleD family two-component response regulator
LADGGGDGGTGGGGPDGGRPGGGPDGGGPDGGSGSRPGGNPDRGGSLMHGGRPNTTIASEKTRKTLLLVDDEAHICSAIQRVLHRDGYSIHTANAAEDAARILADYSIDVIICDQRMPRKKGTDFLREVQRSHPDTVRIILSGAADIDDIAAAMESGAICKFLTKPIDPVLLRANVCEAFSRDELVRGHAARRRDASPARGAHGSTGRDFDSDRNRDLYSDRNRDFDSDRDRDSNRGGEASIPTRAELEPAFDKLVARSVGRGEAVCLLMLQVDQYHGVLGSFGSAFAKTFLDAVIGALRVALGPGCLLGHDTAGTFLVLAATADPSACIARLDGDIDALFAKPVKIGGRHIAATVSVGATVAAPGGAFDALVDEAHAAMMTGSDRGGATMQLFQPHLINAFRKKLELESDLREAVAEKRFLVFYQPQIDIAAGRIVGLEALIRWPHSEGGFVSPAEFIPAAERLGLIGSIGTFVLEAAIAQLAAWTAGGIAPSELAINVSPLQLKARGFVDGLETLLRRHRVPARRLVLEITESAAIEQESAIAESLAGLRGLGVSLAVDDFGTGYANLSNLTRLPFHKLKIDRSLLPKGGDERALRLFTNVVTLAAELGLVPIAEGVETAGELDAVRSAGCGIVQGYLYAEPLGAERLTDLLTRAKARAAAKRQRAPPGTAPT